MAQLSSSPIVTLAAAKGGLNNSWPMPMARSGSRFLVAKLEKGEGPGQLDLEG